MIEESATLSDTIIEKLKKQHLFENLASEDIKSAITRFEEITRGGWADGQIKLKKSGI